MHFFVAREGLHSLLLVGKLSDSSLCLYVLNKHLSISLADRNSHKGCIACISVDGNKYIDKNGIKVMQIIFAKSLNTHQALQNVWPDLDPNCLTLIKHSDM